MQTVIMWLQFQIFLKCSKGWKKMKYRSWKKLRHRTEHVNERSCTLPLQNSNSPSLALFCKHQEICTCFKGAASKHPDHQKRALTRINRTQGDLNSTPQVRCSYVYSTSEFAGSQKKRTTWILPVSKASVYRYKEQKAKSGKSLSKSTFPKGWESPRILACWGGWYTASDSQCIGEEEFSPKFSNLKTTGKIK